MHDHVPPHASSHPNLSDALLDRPPALISRSLTACTAVFLHHLEHSFTSMQAAADPDAAVDGGGSSTADVHGRNGAGERMERTVPSEQQDRNDTHPQQQHQTSFTPSGVLDKLFGKRLLLARHYIMSRKSWLKMVPTKNCDILMTFPDTIDDHTLLWLLNQIRVGIPQVSIQIRQHKHTQAHAFFITTTFKKKWRRLSRLGRLAGVLLSPSSSSSCDRGGCHRRGRALLTG
ncbi:uncharacterized protein LOC121644300 [Melanotaenia boesemani]|uniref:uncharacterized protein LOC121644300 n=1 Tax=Melanotaenia boesemani TaxID=1250792 RepID=UPI001C052889|nr:uncharacterized protein LOC121644300 [Melanotaenia boesemani]